MKYLNLGLGNHIYVWKRSNPKSVEIDLSSWKGEEKQQNHAEVLYSSSLLYDLLLATAWG